MMRARVTWPGRARGLVAVRAPAVGRSPRVASTFAEIRSARPRSEWRERKTTTQPSADLSGEEGPAFAHRCPHSDIMASRASQLYGSKDMGRRFDEPCARTLPSGDAGISIMRARKVPHAIGFHRSASASPPR